MTAAIPGDGCRRRLAVLSAVAMCVLLAVATLCSPHAAAASRAPHGKSSVSLPVNAYELTTEQQAELTYIDDLLVKRCMVKLGFAIAPGLTESFVADDVRIEQEFSSREWGISTLSVAREYGYALPPWTQGPTKPQILQSADERFALTGKSEDSGSSDASSKGTKVPAGGCNGWAARALKKAGLSIGQTRLTEIVGNIRNTSFFEARASATVKKVFARWSACMTRHGYHYSTPFDHPPDSASSGPTRQAAIETAVTDIGCKQATNLLAIAYGVQAKDQRALIDRYEQTLGQLHTQIEKEGRALVALASKYGIP